MNPSKCYGVYAIINQATWQVYIGQTVKTFNRRWGQHRTALRQGKHRNTALQLDWGVYGESSFEFRVLYAQTTRPAYGYVMEQLERAYIEAMGKRAYNITLEERTRRRWH